MKIVVVGAGAMGTLFGGRLARARHEVSFVDADLTRVAAINSIGVFEGDQHVVCDAWAPGTFPAAVDLLIIFTKSTHTALAISANVNILKPDGVVLTLQNGLGNDGIIADVIGQGRTLVGMTNWPAHLIDHGRVSVGGEGHVALWAMEDVGKPKALEVAEALDGAGLRARADPEVYVGIWEKVIFNAALNSSTALTGLTVGGVADTAPVRALALRLVEEGIAVAVARGVAVDPARVRQNVMFALEHHRPHKPSMLQDVEAGRATEVDAILGRLVTGGGELRIPTPCLETCAALLKGVDARHWQEKLASGASAAASVEDHDRPQASSAEN